MEKLIQKTGLKRNTIDKFYTNKETVKLCIKKIIKYLKINKNDLIIEPSAGNGSFIKKIKKICKNYKFYDLEPEHKDIEKQDFLELNIDEIKKTNNKIHIIGNPPFGRQSSLAIKFIKKCCEFANTISFILPKSFKKDSMKKYFIMNYHLVYEMNIPENSFIVNNRIANVPCIFQIWEYKEIPRKKPKKLLPINFEFVKKIENPDISFRRVGVYAGKISTEIQDKSIQSHYFIKFKENINIKELIVSLNKIKYDFDNTVGPKSISKQELIKEFNKIMNQKNH